jgi:hypothetical protein
VVVFLERSGLSQRVLRVACRERWLDTPALWSCASHSRHRARHAARLRAHLPARVALRSADPVADATALHAELKGWWNAPAEARPAAGARRVGRCASRLRMRCRCKTR